MAESPGPDRRYRLPVGRQAWLEVAEVGAPDAPAFVVAHGVGSTSRFVREAFAAPVVDAGWRLVAYDLRGHGGSTPAGDPESLRLERHAADLGAVAAAVGARRVGGVSLGAHAAVAWATGRGDVDGVVACLPAWTGPGVAGQGPHAAIAAEVLQVGVSGVLARVVADHAVPTWLRDLLRRDWSVHDPRSLAAALVALDGDAAPADADLAALRAPLGVVGWSGDPGHPQDVARGWARGAPRGDLELTTLEAVGRDRAALGRAALRALHEAASRPVRGGAGR